MLRTLIQKEKFHFERLSDLFMTAAAVISFIQAYEEDVRKPGIQSKAKHLCFFNVNIFIFIVSRALFSCNSFRIVSDYPQNQI